MIPRSKPVLYAYAMIAFFNVVLGGAALSQFIDPAVIGLANLIVAGVAAFLAVIQSGSNVESKNTWGVTNDKGQAVAGVGSATTIETGSVLTGHETVEEVAPPPGPVS